MAIRKALLLLMGLIFVTAGLYAAYAHFKKPPAPVDEGYKFAQFYEPGYRLRKLEADTVAKLRDPSLDVMDEEEYLGRVLETVKTIEQDPGSPEVLAQAHTEEGALYVRLATAEQSQNDATTAQDSMQKAQQAFKAAGWKDTSERNLRQIVAKMNAQGAGK